jgi:predicted permease
VLLVVVVVFLLGWASQSRIAVPPKWLQWADRYVINVALPAVIVAKVSQVEITGASGIPVLAAWGSMGFCGAVVLIAGRRLAWSQSQIGALLLVAVLGNTSFLGIEVVRTLLGDSHVAAAVTYDQLGTFLALSLYGSWVAGKYGASASGWRSVAHRVSRFTPFIALLVSVAVRGIDIPSQALSVLDGVGLTVAPVAMAVLGARFNLRWSSRVKWIVVGGLSVKMVAAPLALLLIGSAFGDVSSIEWSASVLQSAAPPMVTAGVVAIAAGLDEELVVAMVGTGTLFSFLSLPLFSLII